LGVYSFSVFFWSTRIYFQQLAETTIDRASLNPINEQGKGPLRTRPLEDGRHAIPMLELSQR